MGEVKNHGNNFALLHFIGACMVIYGHMHDLLQVPGPSLLGNGINALGVKMILSSRAIWWPIAICGKRNWAAIWCGV